MPSSIKAHPIESFYAVWQEEYLCLILLIV